MKKTIALAAALTIVASAAASAAPSKQRKHRRAAAPPQQIACTVIGCVPVPRGCSQTPGRTWSGSPTGGDVIVCPPGVAPFR